MSENESIADILTQAMNEESAETETAEAETPEEVSEPQEVAEATDGEDTPTEKNEVVAEAEEASEDAEPEGIPAPEHWSSELKERFAALDPEAQAILVERDGEFQKGYQERAESITAIQQAFEPYKQLIAQMGVSEDQAIRSLLATYQNLLSDPLSGIRGLATSFGVLDQLVTPDTNDDFIDPEIKALREQVSGLQGQLQQFGNQQAQSAQAQGQQQIEAFKSAKDSEGNPLHPHFEDALPTIVSLVQSGKSLDEAYEEAKWTVAAYRDSLQKKEPSDIEKARKVKQARKAAETVKPKGKAPEAAEKELTLHDELALAYKELS